MDKINLRGGGKALVVVAHPDDETIWMGGMIAKRKNLKWTILSLCRAGDKDRAPKFRKVCAHLGAQAIIEDLEDDGTLPISATVPLIKKIILKHIKKNQYDFLFTHGENGEYGHHRHIGANIAVNELLADGKIKPKAVFYFYYRKKYYGRKFSPMIARQKADLVLKLSRREYEAKKKIMSEIYGFAPGGIDVYYCTKEEAFKIVKL